MVLEKAQSGAGTASASGAATGEAPGASAQGDDAIDAEFEVKDD